MREVDHDPPFVHLGHGLSALVAQAVMQPLAISFAGIRIGKLTVPVVRQRHVAAAELLKSFDVSEIQAYRVGVLDADHGHLFARGRDPAHIGLLQVA